MDGGIYQIIVIAVGAFALIKGFRRGLTGQICGVLGMAFGAVCAYIFAPDVAENLKKVVPAVVSFPFPAFVYSVVASSLVYTLVYYSMKWLTRILRRAMKVFHVGMLDKLFGSAFSLLKYMLCLSIIYNILLCVDPKSPLLAYSQADDGNMVSSVLMIAPDVLGCVSVEDLAHALQLLDAKKISCNFRGESLVIDYKESGGKT